MTTVRKGRSRTGSGWDNYNRQAHIGKSSRTFSLHQEELKCYSILLGKVLRKIYTEKTSIQENTSSLIFGCKAHTWMEVVKDRDNRKALVIAALGLPFYTTSTSYTNMRAHAPSVVREDTTTERMPYMVWYYYRSRQIRKMLDQKVLCAVTYRCNEEWRLLECYAVWFL
jgi:hypothetical protein